MSFTYDAMLDMKSRFPNDSRSCKSLGESDDLIARHEYLITSSRKNGFYSSVQTYSHSLSFYIATLSDWLEKYRTTLLSNEKVTRDPLKQAFFALNFNQFTGLRLSFVFDHSHYSGSSQFAILLKLKTALIKLR